MNFLSPDNQQSIPSAPVQPIEGAVIRLEGTITSLAAIADRLESRLSAVLSPPRPGQAADPLENGPTVPLADSLHVQCDRIANISVGLESVLERIGL